MMLTVVAIDPVRFLPRTELYSPIFGRVEILGVVAIIEYVVLLLALRKDLQRDDQCL